MWLKKHRILVLVYTVGLLFGIREFLIRREAPPFEWQTPEGLALLDMLGRLNPDDPDTHYLKAMHALAQGDQDEFSHRLDLALASDAKHNEVMLKFHAEYLLATSTDTTAINAAIMRWRRNFPYTSESITFRIHPFPRTPQQAEAIERGVAGIPWIADSRLGRVVTGGGEQWVLGVMVRRGRPVDVRDVHAAVLRALSS